MSGAFALRFAFALAYPPLAYWATRAGSGGAAVIALLDLALVFLVGPLLRPRAWAWGVAAGLALALFALRHGEVPQVLLLAPPVVFLALLAWLFGRTLRRPRQPLIARIVAALHECPAEQLPPELARYARRLTAAWTLLLAVLAVVNGVLACAEVPGGVLARLGHAPTWGIAREHGSLIANLLNYGVVGGFFVGEYALRRRWFRELPYRHFLDFLQRMGRLGPAFWSGLFR
ncbi:COG4648 family protein [Lysobacter solisilvae (ex Woo and Kim 2020)]|uniref:Ketosynthase n=1 Tax=Agrilutibacter terrestris TaxID=2865112 RepID=A0A7H0FU28_9GAMM|nr:ketosynthase [Lysobacter terrestris]QNP39544.1 ketosynthase [Lysobacter terrestris]